MVEKRKVPAAFRRLPVISSIARYVRTSRGRGGRALAEQRLLPPVIAFELTNSCNLRCAKCPLEDTIRPRGFLEKDLFEKVLRDIENAGVPTELALSGAGEPSLHPRVIEFVAAARRVPNIGVIGFATNGIRMTPDVSEKLLDAGLTRLKASLDADDPLTYKEMNRIDKYDQVVQNFQRFCEINLQTGKRCRVTLKVTLYQEKLDLAEKLKQKWAPFVDEVRVTFAHNWAGLKGGAASASERRPCSLLWQQVQILWDGQITLCCVDSMEGRFNMGNVRDVDISRYWRKDEGLRRTRQKHVEGDLSSLPVCAGCDMDAYADIDLGT